jgi:phosphoserine phosphatase/dolichol kinase
LTKDKTSPLLRQTPRLVVFDVEGVLVPKRRYLLFEASKLLGISGFLKILWAGFLYESGLSSLETALQRIYRQLKGLAFTDLFKLYKKMPLMPRVKQVFEQLKRAGCKTALISSGLPQAFVQDLALELGCDYAFGLDLEVVDDRLTGQIGGDALKPNGKAIILKKIQEKEGLAKSDCATVADDRNNLPMFRFSDTRIGYNPEFQITYKSDAVVKGDLGDIVPILNGSSIERRPISKRELIREVIHMAGFLVPVFTMLFSLNHFFVVSLILAVTGLYVASEIARILGVNVPIISTITWKAAMQPEIYEFITAPIFFAMGIILALIIFPPPISYASIAIFTLGDSFASLFGRKMGNHVFPYNKGKKIEGTLFGFLFASTGASVFIGPAMSLSRVLLAAASGMIMESLPTPVNDNLTIPLAAGLTLLFLP